MLFRSVKGGNQLALGNGPATLAKFDKNTLDGFDNWSSERSATLAELNSRVSDYAVRNALANSSINNSYGRGQGLWIYDRYTGSYTFLPFGRSGWGSPYGWGYNNGVDYNGFMTYCDQRVTQPPAAVTSNVTLGRVVINNGDSGITRETAERSPGPKVTGSAGAPARDNENSRFGGKSLLIERDSGGFGRDRSSDTFGSNSSSGSSSNSSPSRSPSSDSGSSKPAPSPAPSSSGAEVDRSTGGSSRKVIDP